MISINKKSIYTEFEVFYQKLTRDISDIAKNKFTQIKRKLQYTVEKYWRIKVPRISRKIIKKGSNNENTAILKSDVSKYFEKNLLQFNTKYRYPKYRYR